jgi:hypothetical protein
LVAGSALLLSMGCSPAAEAPVDASDEPLDATLDAGDEPDAKSSCVPRECSDYFDARFCGPAVSIRDGCGGMLECEGVDAMACGEGRACLPGSGGFVGAHICRAPGDFLCEPLEMVMNCDEAECGFVTNECSGRTQCWSACGSGTKTCHQGTCQEGACTPIPVEEACAGKCGMVSDGCSGTYACNDTNGGVICEGRESCGYGGVPNECGFPEEACEGPGCPDPESECGIVPFSCEDYGFQCGTWLDGCGALLECGTCHGTTCAMFASGAVCVIFD